MADLGRSRTRIPFLTAIASSVSASTRRVGYSVKTLVEWDETGGQIFDTRLVKLRQRHRLLQRKFTRSSSAESDKMGSTS